MHHSKAHQFQFHPRLNPSITTDISGPATTHPTADETAAKAMEQSLPPNPAVSAADHPADSPTANPADSSATDHVVLADTVTGHAVPTDIPVTD